MKRLITVGAFLACATLSHADEDKKRGLLAEELMSDSTAADTGIDVRGWVSQGFTVNADDPDGGFNGPVSFNDQSNEYQLNQVYLIAERAITKGGDDFSVGGRVDLNFGKDSIFTQSIGFDDDLTADRTSQFYKMALPQAYVEANLPVGNGLVVKAGHFYTPIGYEVVTAPDNMFYSHAYTMQYGEPFTHWGALLSYAVSDELSVTGGVVRGWDNLTDSADDNLSMLGSVSYAFDEKTTGVFSLITGNEGTSSNRTMYSMVLTKKLTDELSWVIQHDLGVQDEADGSAAWYGFNNYFLYALCDELSLGTRIEWFKDEDGTRVAGVRSGSELSQASYYEWTVGAQYKPVDFVIIRPEIRWDWMNRRAGQPYAYDDGKDGNQLTVAVDGIVKF